MEEQRLYSVEDSKRIQLDVTALAGKLIVEEVLATLGDDIVDSDLRLGLALLKAWDFNLDITSVGGSVYEVLKYTTNKNIFDPTLGRELTYMLLGRFAPLE